MKNKTNKKFFVAIMIMLMITMYGFVPMPNGVGAAEAIIDASDTIDDTDVGVTGEHVFDFDTVTVIPEDGYIAITFPGPFGDVSAGGNIVCSDGVASLGDTETALCTAGVGGIAAGTLQVTVSDVFNPAVEGVQYITIETYDDAPALLDRVTVAVFIIEDILMTARVESTLDFTISGVAAAQTVNGVTCDVTTTATTTDFGTLAVDTNKAVCQELTVTTNADDGYTVTVEQDDELTSDSGSNINSFNNAADGTGTVVAAPWANPANTLDSYNTYGHMGLTSDDADLNSLGTYNSFAVGDTDTALQYAGLNDDDPMAVMHHDGPADGSTQNKGIARVLYQARIASLQEAGDYENTLTYIVTPIY